MSLANSAMLASVKIRCWTARKYDRRISDATNEAHNAKADAGRYNKALLGKDALATVTAISTKARTELYARTSPWMDDGPRILTAVGYLPFAREMRALRAEYGVAVSDFVASYDDFVSEAKSRLGSMFDPADYPSADEVAKRFGFDIVIQPVPQSGDFRVTAAGISDVEREAIKADIERRTADAINAAMQDVANRVVEKVGHMVEKLRAYTPARDTGDKAQGVFRDSLVENVRELADLLPSLNLTNDTRLDAIAARIKAELTFHDADELRDDVNARKLTADAAESILRDVNVFFA